MFTGIISRVGYVFDIQNRDGGRDIKISVDEDFSDLNIGDSISILGCCLTITSKEPKTLGFFISQETLKITTLAMLTKNSPVNFEKAMLASSRINGHNVLGHVDGVCRVVKADVINGNMQLEIEVPKHFMNFVVVKGSVAIDGVSLTIMDIKKNVIVLNIIPHTLANTTLRFLNTSSNNLVNAEFDEMVKVIYNVVNAHFKNR